MIRLDMPWGGGKLPVPKVVPPAPPAPVSSDLRDALASQVMAILLDKECSGRWDCARWAFLSYEMADAMLEARKK